jgi:hypothetical protein
LNHHHIRQIGFQPDTRLRSSGIATHFGRDWSEHLACLFQLLPQAQ